MFQTLGVCERGRQLLRPPYGMRTLLTVPFALQLTSALVLVGYLSFANSQRELSSLARRLQIETADRIVSNIKTQVEAARHLTTTNVGLIERGVVSINDLDRLGDLFTEQLKVMPVSYISYGNAQGEFVGLERHQTGLRLNRVSRDTGLQRLQIYQLNAQGDRQTQLPSKTWNPQSEAWYSDAVKRGQPLWTSIYVWEDQPDIISISLSYPLYGVAQTAELPGAIELDEIASTVTRSPADPSTLLGVFSIDLILTDLSNFLKQLKIGETGRALIVEPDGSIVASSYDQPVAIVNGKAQRRRLGQGTDPMSKAIWRTLQDQMAGSSSLSRAMGQPVGIRAQNGQPKVLTIAGERQFVTVTRLQDDLGLDWSIVIIVPESDFMGRLWAAARYTLVLGVGILMVTLVGYLWLGDRLTRSIRQLTQAAGKLAVGHWQQPLPTSMLREVNQLSNTFAEMARELDHNFQALQDTKAMLETRVEARTA